MKIVSEHVNPEYPPDVADVRVRYPVTLTEQRDLVINLVRGVSNGTVRGFAVIGAGSVLDDVTMDQIRPEAGR